MSEDRPAPDFTMDELLDELLDEVFPQQPPMYYGKGAFTATEVARKRKCCKSHAYRLMQEACDAPGSDIVKVRVWREGKRKPLYAWVKRRVYERYKDIVEGDLG